MGYFSQLGKPLFSGSATLQTGTLTAALFVPVPTAWSDVYSVTITTDETTARTVTISDGTTIVVYQMGTTSTPIIDSPTVPIRFGKGATITATVNAIGAGKHIAINIRGLVSAT